MCRLGLRLLGHLRRQEGAVVEIGERGVPPRPLSRSGFLCPAGLAGRCLDATGLWAGDLRCEA